MNDTTSKTTGADGSGVPRHADPVAQTNRFESLDILRGVAVLGILMVNVQSFTMVPNAYIYPPAHMDLSGENGMAWLFTRIFFEMKFITIFSALFGAGVLLMVGEDRAASRKLHYSRMRWLLAFGVVHCFGLWYGDILMTYAISGFIVVALQHMSATKLLLWGVFWVCLGGLFWFALFGSIAIAPAEMQNAEDMQFTTSAEGLQDLLAPYADGYLASRIPNALNGIYSIVMYPFFGGRIIGIMFVGMALFKLGFLKGQWSVRSYLACAVVGLGIGLPVTAITAQGALDTGFPVETMWIDQITNYFASPFVSFGYAGLIMIVAKTPWLALVRRPFAAAGQMAFTNYLTQTMVMVFLTVGGIGMGLFGQLERVEQVQLVLVVWLVQLIISPIWLSIFRFGPLEWLWRSLSYGKIQPLTKPAPPLE
jgi:uncharacterized protein